MQSDHHPHELWQSLQELEAGTLGEPQREALMREITDSPQARALYLEYFEMSALLTNEARMHSEQESLPQLPRPSPRLRLRMPQLLALAAAACVLLGLLIHLSSSPDPAGPAAAVERMTTSAVAGTIWEIRDQRGKALAADGGVSAGSTVQVHTGSLTLFHPSGAQLMLQGPSRVRFSSLNQASIEQGWLWLDTHDSAEAFEIETPELLLRDIGTRFGIRVAEQGPAEIHLFEGQVDAYAKQDMRKLVQLRPEQQGVLVYPDREPAAVALAADPFPRAQDMMGTAASYETILLSQTPTDYWRVDQAQGTELINRIGGGTTGRLHPSIGRDASGPGADSGLPGFGAGNRALRLEGRKLWAPVSLGSAPFHRGLLFGEDFADAGSLHHHRPTLGESREHWVSSPAFAADGRIEPLSTGTATLAFTPIHGRIYTLDATFENVHSKPGVDSWVGLGFASGQSISSYIYGMRENRFLEGQTTGRAWLLFRATGSPLEHQACLGATGSNGGIADAPPWINWEDGSGGSIDLRVILDTTGGPGHWTAQWLAKRPTQQEYRIVRPESSLLHEEIHSVGIAVGKEGLSGRVRSFSLRSEGGDEGPEEWLAQTPARLKNNSGSISLWIQPHAQRERDQIIWSAGNSPGEDAMHLRLKDSGQVGFFIDNDRYDLLLSSATALHDGRWHHIVACWATDRVELYVDGRLSVRANDDLPMTPKLLRELHLGSGALRSDYHPLQASIDEIAVWDRPLTAREIRTQYEAAHGQIDTP